MWIRMKRGKFELVEGLFFNNCVGFDFCVLIESQMAFWLVTAAAGYWISTPKYLKEGVKWEKGLGLRSEEAGCPRLGKRVGWSEEGFGSLVFVFGQLDLVVRTAHVAHLRLLGVSVFPLPALNYYSCGLIVECWCWKFWLPSFKKELELFLASSFSSFSEKDKRKR